MYLTIIFILIFLIISLDSFGSKRIRSKLIKRTKAAFERALDQNDNIPNLEKLPAVVQKFLSHTGSTTIYTCRFKMKGAYKAAGSKRWQALESKFFLTPYPLSYHFYEDSTLSFLVSKKNFILADQNKKSFQHRILSLFNIQKKWEAKPEEEVLIQLLTYLPWIPTLAIIKEMEWESKAKDRASATLSWGAYKMTAHYQFHNKGSALKCQIRFKVKAEEITLDINYQDYREYDGLQIPFAYTMSRGLVNKQSPQLTKHQLTEIVYNETFSWW